MALKKARADCGRTRSVHPSTQHDPALAVVAEALGQPVAPLAHQFGRRFDDGEADALGGLPSAEERQIIDRRILAIVEIQTKGM